MSGTMGHSHSSSHKRLRSISSTRNCGGEFTEVVDLEFSDAGPLAEPVTNQLPDNGRSKTSPTNNKPTNCLSEDARGRMESIQYPRELVLLGNHVKEVEKSIENMSSDEFFVYFPTLKDDLHNCWQKVYGVREENLETKLRKHEVIDHIRELLRKLNAKLQRREFGE